MMTFREFYVSRPRRGTGRGLHIVDNFGGNDFPDVKSWKELKSHLIKFEASDTMISTAKLAWKAYEDRKHTG